MYVRPDTVTAEDLRNALETGVLDLVNRGLTKLPTVVFALQGLRVLSLHGNALTELPPEIGNLQALEILDLDGNGLTTLPAEIEKLTRLQILDLHDNRLTVIPPEIGKLRQLNELDLRNNLLKSLPPEIADHLIRGALIELDGNPFTDPLSEVMARGVDALTTYLRSLSDSVEQYEAKVMLVGEGEVGKSSMLAALANRPFLQGRPMTHGIEIHEMSEQHPTLNVPMTLRVWDFGGQEVYRVTHQFFFSSRALYVLVWNPRKGQEQNEIEGWLRRIKLRVGDDARVLIVATHGAIIPYPELDYPRLLAMFPGMLVGNLVIDNETGHGIEKLHQTIARQVVGLPRMGAQLSRRWVAIREAISKLKEGKPQIQFGEFEEICAHHDVFGPDVTVLANLLHDLGQIIYYADDFGLRDTVVLNPEWLTKAIALVLADREIYERRGLLDHERLARLWGDAADGGGYPAKYHPYFLRLMEKFDISFRVPEEPTRSLIAQRVPYEKPKIIWQADSITETRHKRLRLVFKLGENPPGLVSWLTVRHHRNSVNQHWRSGVFVRHQRYESEGLIELDHRQRLTLDVRAPYPDTYLNILRGSVEDLIGTRWPGLEYAVCIPCPTPQCDNDMPLTTLRSLHALDKYEVACMACAYSYPIASLLTSYVPEPNSLHEIVVRIESKLDTNTGTLALMADLIRTLMAIASAEINDCPRLFTIASLQPTGLAMLDPTSDRYRLTLWCEHPDAPHPWEDAEYNVSEARPWLRRIAPYAELVFRALRIVVPVVGAVTELQLSHGHRPRSASEEIALMRTVVELLPEHVLDDQIDLARLSQAPRAAEGSALRAFRAMLFNLDKKRAFGDLRRVLDPSGQVLWVCKDHYPIYDPGLPHLPAVTT